MVSFVLVTHILGSDRAHVLPGGDEYAEAVTALSGTHFTTWMPSAPVPPVRVGRQEVNTSVLNGFPGSQRFRSRALFVGRRVGRFVAVGSVPEKRVFLWVVPLFRISSESWSSVCQRCVRDEVFQPLHRYYRSCFVGPFFGHSI